MTEPIQTSTNADTARSPLSLLLLGIGIVVALIVAWLGRVILMLLFAAIVVAVLLGVIVDWLKARLKLRASVALAILFAVAVILVALTIWLIGPSVLSQLAAFKPIYLPRHIPLAGILRMIAALFTFSPMSVRFSLSFRRLCLHWQSVLLKACLPFALLLLVHFLEGNLITPLLERRIVSLPPALTMTLSYSLP